MANWSYEVTFAAPLNDSTEDVQDIIKSLVFEKEPIFALECIKVVGSFVCIDGCGKWGTPMPITEETHNYLAKGIVFHYCEYDCRAVIEILVAGEVVYSEDSSQPEYPDDYDWDRGPLPMTFKRFFGRNKREQELVDQWYSAMKGQFIWSDHQHITDSSAEHQPSELRKELLADQT